MYINNYQGKSLDSHSPNPTIISSFWALAFKIILSLSSQNVLSSPESKDNLFFPIQLNSKKEPYSSLVGPDIVPEPKKSPTYKSHPVTV